MPQKKDMNFRLCFAFIYSSLRTSLHGHQISWSLNPYCGTHEGHDLLVKISEKGTAVANY